MATIPSILYYTSAFVNAATIPKHISVGIKHVYKVVDQVPPSPELVLGKRVATTTWDFASGTLGILALLNYKWATTGGPSSWEERMIIYTYMCTGAYVGWQYFKIRMYAELGCLWVAPLLSTVAMLWW